jgi:hypothetical protein
MSYLIPACSTRRACGTEGFTGERFLDPPPGQTLEVWTRAA